MWHKKAKTFVYSVSIRRAIISCNIGILISNVRFDRSFVFEKKLLDLFGIKCIEFSTLRLYEDISMVLFKIYYVIRSMNLCMNQISCISETLFFCFMLNVFNPITLQVIRNRVVFGCLQYDFYPFTFPLMLIFIFSLLLLFSC